MIIHQEIWKQLICQSLGEGEDFFSLAQESKSTEFRIVVSVQQSFLCHRASQTLEPGSPWLPAARATCACMQRAPALPGLSPHISPSSPFKSSHPGRSCCTAEELHRQGTLGVCWDFWSCYSDLGSCLSSLYSRQPA